MDETHSKTLILVGGGHSHLYLIKQMKKDQLKSYQVILISVGNKQYYSGMASSYLEGIYAEEDFTVDLKKLCKKSGVYFIEDEVLLIRPIDKTIVTRKGQTYEYDLLSLDTGSDVVTKQIQGAKEFSNFVKPLQNLRQIKKIIIEELAPSFEVVVIGAGAAGAEIALGIRQLGLKTKKNIHIRIIDSGNEILKGYSAKVKSQMKKALNEAHVQLIQKERVSVIEHEYLEMESSNILFYDLLIMATGSVAHRVYRKSGLEVDERGYMFVNVYLQNEDYPDIFGAGDCIAFKDYPYVTKIGVYAIKEAPILWKNIKRRAQGKPLKKYVPQKNYLSIISLGNRRGIMSYKELVFNGKWTWHLKDCIDRKFIRQYQ